MFNKQEETGHRFKQNKYPQYSDVSQSYRVPIAISTKKMSPRCFEKLIHFSFKITMAGEIT
jgi:hypothetical protein